MPPHADPLLAGFDEPLRVAVVAEPGTTAPGTAQARLLEVLAGAALPGIELDLPGRGTRVGPGHDLLHLLGDGSTAGPEPGTDPGASAVALAREHGIELVAHYPAAPRLVAPGRCRIILSPGAGADADLIAHGARPEQLRRWRPGVDPERFGPGHFRSEALPRAGCRVHVLALGDGPGDRIHAAGPGAGELLEVAFAAARRREPRLMLHAAGDDATRPVRFASADLLVCLDTGDDLPMEILEAQASGLPVLALDAGGSRELIEDGRSGVLVPATARDLADALVVLARRATLRERLTVGGLAAARARRWDAALADLHGAWTAALGVRARLLRAA